MMEKYCEIGALWVFITEHRQRPPSRQATLPALSDQTLSFAFNPEKYFLPLPPTSSLSPSLPEQVL